MSRSFLLQTLIGFLVAILVVVGLAYLLFGRGGEAKKIRWGVEFDPYYAQYLGLDWKKTYLSLLDEVGVDHLRLVAFWDAVEPEDDQFDFTRLDFQVQEAEKRGYWTGNIPKKIRGWRQEADRLTVPRGFARQLVAILRGAGPGAQKVYGG